MRHLMQENNAVALFTYAEFGKYVGNYFVADSPSVKLGYCAKGALYVGRNGILGEAELQARGSRIYKIKATCERGLLSCRGNDGICAHDDFFVGKHFFYRSGKSGDGLCLLLCRYSDYRIKAL